jgi:hypothetical protein
MKHLKHRNPSQTKKPVETWNCKKDEVKEKTPSFKRKKEGLKKLSL